jgi:16S rRNA (cytosine1402-N4)-methyltransferase
MQYPDVSLTGSLSVGKMASSNSARYRLARSGEKSRRHSSAEGLPVSEANEFRHAPVMEREVVEVFAEVPTGHIIDATLGGAGHSVALLESRPDISIIGIDRDVVALTAARERLARYGHRATTRRSTFGELNVVLVDLLAEVGADGVSGALFDLGVSSPQLDVAERGFSYRVEAPLDMRMDASQGPTAADVVNTYERDDLARIIRDHADERFARRIADAIIAARPITTTSQLTATVTAAIPAATRRRGGHPAKRTFQALRIEVNGELEQLPRALAAAINATRPNGRVAVISYHSGEDRIVTDVLRQAETGGCTCRPGLPCGCGATPQVKRVRAPRHPSRTEVEANPRARRARFRVVEKLPVANATREITNGER